MTALRTYWNRLGGLLVLALALVLVLAPVADAAVCATEDASPAAVQMIDTAAAQLVAADDEAGVIHLGEQGEACQHGHCHHGAPTLAPLVGDVLVVALRSDTPHPLQADQHPSRVTSRLDRPPRV